MIGPRGVFAHQIAEFDPGAASGSHLLEVHPPLTCLFLSTPNESAGLRQLNPALGAVLWTEGPAQVSVASRAAPLVDECHEDPQ